MYVEAFPEIIYDILLIDPLESFNLWNLFPTCVSNHSYSLLNQSGREYGPIGSIRTSTHLGPIGPGTHVDPLAHLSPSAQLGLGPTYLL